MPAKTKAKRVKVINNTKQVKVFGLGNDYLELQPGETGEIDEVWTLDRGKTGGPVLDEVAKGVEVVKDKPLDEVVKDKPAAKETKKTK